MNRRGVGGGGVSGFQRPGYLPNLFPESLAQVMFGGAQGLPRTHSQRPSQGGRTGDPSSFLSVRPHAPAQKKKKQKTRSAIWDAPTFWKATTRRMKTATGPTSLTDSLAWILDESQGQHDDKLNQQDEIDRPAGLQACRPAGSAGPQEPTLEGLPPAQQRNKFMQWQLKSGASLHAASRAWSHHPIVIMRKEIAAERKKLAQERQCRRRKASNFEDAKEMEC